MSIQFLLLAVLATAIAAMLEEKYKIQRAMKIVLMCVGGMSLAFGLIGGAA